MEKYANIQIEDVLKKEFKSKLEQKNKKISTYMAYDKLLMEEIMQDYTNYIYTIIRNFSINLSKEDIEEVVLDVFLILWKNQYKLDVNKSMSAYISGITKNLIKYRYRQNKIVDNIEDYEEHLIDFTNIELILAQNEKEKIISNELDMLKQEDREIFIEYYYTEKSIKEISKIYNMSDSKVKSKLFRVRKRLNKVLRKRGYGSNEK